MAGLQHGCRKLLIYNTSRLINRNGTLLQPSRSRHHLVFRISSLQNRTNFQKTKLLFDTDRHQLIFRLASTNVNIAKEPVSDVSNSETVKTTTTTESVQANSNAVASNSESGVVQSSASNVVIDDSSLPPAPVPDVDEIPVMEFVSTNLKEPSFESLGLGSWWPSGIIQQIFEYLHVNLDLEWWQAIVAVTFVTRILLFPITLSTRRDTINTMNHLPEMNKFQKRITEARTSGDYYAAATASMEMQTFMKEKKINMLAFLKTALVQGPIFFSMFYALKGMAAAPVESLKTGGLFWFTDLTATDPYYILPVCLSSTLLLIIELGAEGNPANANTHTVKWFMRAIPAVVLLVSTRFSTCITWYWTVSNLIVLGQVSLLKVPAVARFFNLPNRIKFDPTKVPTEKKGFIEGFKEGFKNAQLSGQIEDRERVNLMEFQKAGTGAIPRTFKRNPVLAKEKK